MADLIAVETVNVEELRAALREAPRQTYTFVKQEMARFGKRFRKKFIRERMSGPPGITAAKSAAGRNVKGRVYGNDLQSLRTVLKISRFLRLHEEGGTIRPQKGDWLFLSRKTGVAGKGHIFARVRSVTIPPRLGFAPMANREIRDDLIPRIANAMQRAMRVAMEQRMKAVARFTSRLAEA